MDVTLFEKLKSSGEYEISQKINLDEANVFFTKILSDNTKTKTIKSKILQLLIIAIVSGLIGYGFGMYLLEEGNRNFSYYWFFLILILLPIHELIHALAYKYCGATGIGFGGSWKSLMVYAYAQNWPSSMKELKLIAISPFIVITSLLILLIIVFPQSLIPLVFNLIVHTLMCLGDFALIKYAIKNPDDILVDDILNEKAMFFYTPKTK